jgi:hypothetical protein
MKVSAGRPFPAVENFSLAFRGMAVTSKPLEEQISVYLFV